MLMLKFGDVVDVCVLVFNPLSMFGAPLPTWGQSTWTWYRVGYVWELEMD